MVLSVMRMHGRGNRVSRSENFYNIPRVLRWSDIPKSDFHTCAFSLLCNRVNQCKLGPNASSSKYERIVENLSSTYVTR